MSTLSDVGSGAGTGAAIGAALGGGVLSIPAAGAGAIIGGIVGLAPSLFKLFSGSSQKKQANAIHPVDPGYQVNNQTIDNARILGDRYNNYTLPGYTQAQTNINNSAQNAYSQGVQGATSGSDVADLAAKLAYGSNVANSNLAAANAQGKDAALGSYLDANAAAGKEYQNKNEYDRGIFQQKLREKAALTQAGNTNEYSALDSAAPVVSSTTSLLANYLNPKVPVSNTGTVKNLGSIFSDGTSGQPASTGNIDFSNLYQRYPQMGVQ